MKVLEIMSVPLYYIIWTNLYIVNKTPVISPTSSFFQFHYRYYFPYHASNIFLIFHVILMSLKHLINPNLLNMGLNILRILWKYKV